MSSSSESVSSSAMTFLKGAQDQKQEERSKNKELLDKADSLLNAALKTKEEADFKTAYEAYKSVTDLSGKENFNLIGIAHFYRAEIDCWRYLNLQSNKRNYMDNWKNNINSSYQYFCDNNNFRSDCPLNLQQRSTLRQAHVALAQSRLEHPILLGGINAVLSPVVR